MCGGGGARFNFPQQDNSADRMMAQIAQQEQARKLAAEEEARVKFGEAKTNALSTVLPQYFRNTGLQWDEGIANSIVSDLAAKVPNLDPTPSAYFNSDAISGWFDNYNNQQRQGLNNQVAQVFRPGFERQMIRNSADDQFLRAILGEQEGRAMQTLDFNRARGLLNDTGYNTALGELGNQRSAGMSTLNTIGNSILDTGRQDLLGIRGDAGMAASQWAYGMDRPNINKFYGMAERSQRDFMKDLEGSIRGTVGNTQFFDVPTLLQSGGTAQGPINLTTRTGDALAFDPERRKQSQGRGLGGGGVF